MKNKFVAALLAFFLGWFGVHKFYLGETGLGFLYLLLFWTAIPRIVSFIEGIILLCTSDRVFDAKYNYNALQSSPQPAIRQTYQQPVVRQESVKEKASALGDLKRLYEEDIITAEEYEEKRRKIFDSI
ncbi:MAG: NINE protein [Cyanobacteria bacterium J06598_1]